ncbi:MAG TPA: rod shape-determining protein MreD [Chloroflexi bacterium]|nr:rod shape-determining protein MreD [Chloroflexota bacterium]HAL27906.1 rod shape-determining protein MreD [Chloroflexota bacterium]
MRIALAIAIPLAAALLQSAVVPFISIGGARPNLPFLVAGSWSLAAGAGDGVWWAFVGGLAADLLSGGPLGAFAVASLPPVAAIGLGERPAPRSTPVLIGASFLTAAAFVAGVLYAIALSLAGTTLPDVSGLTIQIGGGAIFTGVLGIATYPIARGLSRLTEKQASF